MGKASTDHRQRRDTGKPLSVPVCCCAASCSCLPGAAARRRGGHRPRTPSLDRTSRRADDRG